MTAVVFDFDGVLADTEGLHLRAFQETFAACGWTLTERDYTERYLGYDDRTTMAAYLRDRGLPETAEAVEELMREKALAFERLVSSAPVLYPSAATCVRALAARFPLAIASGSLRVEIAGILERAGLLAAFRGIVSAEDVGRSKPAPDPFLRAADLLDARPDDCVAIEDSRWGIEAARHAGMKAIGITTTSPAGALAAADRIIGALDELTPELVEALAAQGRS
jgi:HAD superfamily hydrolase (TIGR01509 family)